MMCLFLLFAFLTQLCSLVANEDLEFCPIDKPKACSESKEDRQLDHNCFRAAVFEHQRIDSGSCKKNAESNLEIFAKVAPIAASHGASIIVFPEDGLFISKQKEDLIEVLTEIPDPHLLNDNNNNPCIHSEQFESSFILRNLSCIARHNNLYVIANFGTKQGCEPKTKLLDQECPDSGQFTFNTNVVLDSNGNFIKRYRKYNIFIEVFDQAPSVEEVYFDSPYGRFGIFTCFDMIFKEPAINLIEHHHIDTVLFPTWWYDELPLLSAIQIQDGWSSTHKVNMLASNIQRPQLGSTGSGIFTKRESIYTGANTKQSKLIIANLPKKYHSEVECNDNFNPLIVDIDTDQDPPDYEYKQYQLLKSDSIYTLEESEAVNTVCDGKVCCTIDYKIEPTLSAELLKRLVVIVRDNPRPGLFEWYEQVCILATLDTPIDKHKLDETKFSKIGLASFERLSLEGTFNSKYVYPIGAYNVSKLLRRDERKFNCDQLNSKQDTIFLCKLNYSKSDNKETIYSFGMYGRLYDKDMITKIS